MAFSSGDTPMLVDSEENLNYLTKAGDFFTNYGWIIFAVFIAVGIYWNKIQKKLDQWYEKYEEKKYAAKYHKNPDIALERLEQLQLARQKMQEELDRKAKEFQEKQKEKELKKAQERLAKAEAQEKGNRLGYGSSSNSSHSEYSPLVGDTSRGYRPPRRSGCPGGGCGR